MALQTRKRKTRMYEPWGYQEENNYESSGGQLMEDLDKFFADAKYNKNDKKIHFYNQDGEEKANIDVSDFATSVIDSVNYDSTTKILTIKFANGDVISINLADLIDENEFGDGLVVNEGIVSILIDASGEPYLTVSENGLKLDGLDDAIGEKVNIQIESALTEINSSITEINSAITNINSALTNVESSTTYIESSFTYINSAITNVEGDIININSAITNIQGDIIDINSAITIMGDDITEINSAITIIGDNINEVNSAITIIEGDIVEINSAITDIYSSITEINSALTETITDVNINEDADLELMNHDTLLDTVPLTDYYYTKYDISQKELTISAALNDLEDRKIDDVQYNPGFRLRSCGTLKFYSTNEDVKTELFSIDLDELFDNASFTNKYINDVKYEEITSGESGSEITYQAITFYNVTESGETLVAAIDARPFLSGGSSDQLWVAGTSEGALTPVSGNNVASGSYSIAYGWMNSATTNYAVAEGTHNLASGVASHAMGNDTKATGENSFAGGFNSLASGKNSFAFGENIGAEGETSVAIGYGNAAVGKRSVAIGDNNLAFADSSVAIGFENKVSGDSAVTIGASNTVVGAASFAEGSGNTTYGMAAHAEGFNTHAFANFSHSEGDTTHASGDSSHAEGHYTITQNQAEHAGGRHNVTQKANNVFGDSGNTLFSIGNGEGNWDSGHSHNAIEIMQNGDIYIANTNEAGAYYEKPMIKLQNALSIITNLEARVAYLEALLAQDGQGNIPLNQEGQEY